MENYLNGIKTAILLHKAGNVAEREEVYSSAREAARHFLKENSASDEDFFQELFLLEASIDEVEHSISHQEQAGWQQLGNHQLAA